jgi:hypothetical protein
MRAVGKPAGAEPLACASTAATTSTASRATAAAAAARSARASLLPPAAKEGEEKPPSCLKIFRYASSTSSSTAAAMASSARASPHAVERRRVMRGQLSPGRLQAYEYSRLSSLPPRTAVPRGLAVRPRGERAAHGGADRCARPPRFERQAIPKKASHARARAGMVVPRVQASTAQGRRAADDGSAIPVAQGGTRLPTPRERTPAAARAAAPPAPNK